MQSINIHLFEHQASLMFNIKTPPPPFPGGIRLVRLEGQKMGSRLLKNVL